jgi:hypothetical protein
LDFSTFHSLAIGLFAVVKNMWGENSTSAQDIIPKIWQQCKRKKKKRFVLVRK